MSMKKTRLVCTAILSFVLILSVLAGTAMPVYAAEMDMEDYLMKILGISSSAMSSYSTDYKNSLPIDYEPTTGSCYVALGGDTAYGQGSDSFETCYADQIANKLNVAYENAAQTGLIPADAVSYINGDNDRKKVVPTAIKGADLITIQLDATALISASMSGVLDGTEVVWSKYVTDSTVLAELKNFRTKATEEYAAEYGEGNAKSIAIVLEYMLYECAAYSYETMNAVQAIRSLNSDAVVLVLSMYNPLRNLKFSANGKTVDIGGMIDEMIGVCNAYLLKQTKSLKNTAFIDVSNTNTVGYSTIELDINNSDDLQSKLTPIFSGSQENLDKQYANQKGHDYIATQVLNSAKAPCKHTKTTVVGKTAATCKSTGYTGDTVCSDCQEVLTKGSTISKLDHSYGSWTQTKAPTCTDKGTQTRTCKSCSQSETRSVDATGHAWDNGTVAKNPTCTVKGEKVYTCKNCSTTKSEEIATVDHSYGEGVVTQEPTCKKEGTKTYTCKTCPKTKTESIAKVDHVWDKGVVTKEPTCKKEGTKTYTCSTCSTTKTETLNKLAHAWDEGVVTKEPDCNGDGVKTFTCATCSTTKTETLAQLAHIWDEGVVTKEPDCNNEGETTFTCTLCSGVQTEAIPVTEHVWDEGVVTLEPDCKNEGEKTFTCSICSATNTEVIPTLEHAWDEGVVTVEPDCETDGEKTTTCSNCGDTQTEVLPATGHSYGDYVSNGDATCQSDGTKTAVCGNCGAEDTVTEADTRMEHVYADGVCSACGAEEPAQPSNSGVWIVVGCAAVVVLGGGAAGFWFFKKKKAVKQ